ncbi:primosomal protein N' [Ferruginibacter paludis]|uniref:replication restart helicase PriA n=1 Tax=Ferruginibacter paludis TaxID=1310417 RepID=UPI0025B38A25|nr:primosomal protein N' [Ferruginibacter paludis]MDN3655689.1 primosomal protein N' [Ferruginibacter paludis]
MDNSNEIIFDSITVVQKISLYAEVILPLALPTTYTYAVPAIFADKIKPGCRVEVVLGKNKRYAGIIKLITPEAPAYTTKEILNVLDDEPVLYPQQLQLWNWMSQYYMCSEGEVMAAALPAHFKLSSETILLFNEDYGDDFSSLNNEEYLVAEALLIKKQLNLTEVQQVLDVTHVYPVIKKLIDKKVCVVWEALSERYKSKKENFVVLNPQYDTDAAMSELLNNWTKAPKQMELLLSYLHLIKTTGEVTQVELLKKSGATAAQLNGLAEKKILLIEKRTVDRIKALPKAMEVAFDLSAAQEICLLEVQQCFSTKNVCLLHGVTSSGKTQIYIKLIEAYYKQEKQVLYLLPEIALTAQMIRRLQFHFGGNIAIYHSKFNNNERVELWNKIKTGEVRIVLGARSALFLPFKDLGLIVVDEEHDPSFKQQDPAPRYNARDAAVYYGALFNAKILLGSATPSIETYYNAQKGKYGLVELNERFGGIHLPTIEIINTRQVAQKGKVMLSPQLKEAIEKTVAAGRQVILFQNRRGYSPYLICGTCGYLPQCKNCDVTLTLHKYSNKLHCHYCGTTYPKITACPACGSVNWIEKNFGTEKIEEMIEDEFPSLKVARMDVDSVRGKSAHDNLIKLFEQQRIDVLVGTQMVVKGLDFEKVSLVGILDADGLLSFADFRVNERAFQLMEQVSGRAGRKESQGNVLIQATQINHPVLQFVKEHDYKKLYSFEINNRQQFFYPPFSRIIEITLKHKVKEVVDEAANKLAAALQKNMSNFVVGPAAPVVARIRNQYLMELLIKLPLDTKQIQLYKQIIRNEFNLLLAEKQFKSVVMIADVDAN